jgi:purine catabolism regulator
VTDVQRLIHELAVSPGLRPFRELLDPLVVYDGERNSDLVRTLTVYFDCGENASEAADRLFLHRNSVPYRLERVRELTGLDYRDNLDRLALRLGLLALHSEGEKEES